MNHPQHRRTTARDLEADEIEVRMLPRANLLPGIRAMAAEMAMRADHDLDSISDLRLAVEEACATMAANADPERTLTCRMLVGPSRTEIIMYVTLPGRRPAVSALALRLLRTLCDTVDYWTSVENAHELLHVHLIRTLRT